MQYKPRSDDPELTTSKADASILEHGQVLQQASMMLAMKNRLFGKAKANIDHAQCRDKLYYDRKYASPRVCIYFLVPFLTVTVAL